MTHPISTYLNNLKKKLVTGVATEHTYRGALATLFEALDESVRVINEPSRVACGAPDLVILHGDFQVGHVEAKDIGASLDLAEKSEQLKRYRLALENLILTDYLEFRWYVDGELRRSARLASPDPRGQLQLEANGRKNLEELLKDFLAHQPQPISTPRELAERMARLTHLIRDVIVNAFEADQASELLKGWRRAFAQVLIPDLDQPENLGQFADMFAQTLSYGLFSARIMHTSGTFHRYTAKYSIPRTNPFLRDFFSYITGPQLSDEPYAGFVDDLIQVLANADMHAILADFGRATRQDDPMMHFYETFLAAYDPKLKERRGVYFTPMPVVSFIVRSVDELLKTRFNLPQGLADTSRLPDGTHKVLVLDPAVGTATFLYAVIDLIRDEFMARNDAGMWSGYVRDHLLKRIFGFEIMMAPYAVAHFKLALQLAGHDLDLPEEQQERWRYDFQADDRIQVYLTNTLEVLPEGMQGLYGPMQFVAEEAKAADEVKQEKPIMVVLGNPPYSGHSANDNPWIDGLLKGELPDGTKEESYYEIDGEPLQERNPKWLQDDYVKFIRFGQWRISNTDSGILAFITNHAFLDNPTFRGMRHSLLSNFSEIFILDLHGNIRKNEESPEKINDENVFDIKQGVVISFFVKKQGYDNKRKIFHSELWGKRAEKYQKLFEDKIDSIKWEEIHPTTPHYLFIPQNQTITNEFNKFWSIVEIFQEYGSTVTTARNHFSISFTPEVLHLRISDLKNKNITDDDLRKKYHLKDVSYWTLSNARSEVEEIENIGSYIEEYCYRPFDFRFVYYHHSVCERLREEIMKHIRDHENISLLTHRPQSPGDFTFIFVTKLIGDQCVAANKSAGGGNSYQLPLYLYPESYKLFDNTSTSDWPADGENHNRVPNLNSVFIREVEEKLEISFDSFQPVDKSINGTTFGPHDILAYIYAILHSPQYRKRYSEPLRIDFPRVPLTSDAKLFRTLVSLGRELIALHLMESPKLHDRMTHFPIPGDNTVAPRGGYPKYTPPAEDQAGRVYINREQYFAGVPQEVWEFEIGGYQVLHKWLKDRRGRVLNYEDQMHYQQIVVALSETIRLMAEIDTAIPAWPIV